MRRQVFVDEQGVQEDVVFDGCVRTLSPYRNRKEAHVLSGSGIKE